MSEMKFGDVVDIITGPFGSAFTSSDKICKSPSTKWKKYYKQLKEGQV